MGERASDGISPALHLHYNYTYITKVLVTRAIKGFLAGRCSKRRVRLTVESGFGKIS